MSRKEKKLQADTKRAEITMEIARAVNKAVKDGKTVKEALVVADRWVHNKIKMNPQKKSMYIDAAVKYYSLLLETLKQTNKGAAA